MIREYLEKQEQTILCDLAAFSVKSKGRENDEKPCTLRTAYMVDRDRIIHSKSFRRLKHKTQVYIKTDSDHYRTRLTHTLEVSQIARTIGKALMLNCDLIEAIALGHDIGHVPFAHNGEEVLNELLSDGFKHNINSIRVLRKMENHGKGLNLTHEVLDGILHHSGLSRDGFKSETLEGQIVKISDKIAYVNHDIDDSVRAGLLDEKMLPIDAIKVLGKNHGDRIDCLVKDVINVTEKNIKEKNKKISMSLEVQDALHELRGFMFKNVYKGDILKREREQAKFVIEQVFKYFKDNLEEMPEFYRSISEREGIERGVVDYIAGMSDDYCIHLFNKIYVPKYVIF
ncbi:deoxyguanosinetriphosphate triphosphohydrolase [Oceanirhabdus sp. W0125-5]|uniref:deoxyguanosinetriphosphate triphosphohydrolase n=1 Tax=Oceanirhabdus sp. W0125-5 TaxID=2999116 RepID=UPI0022F2EF1F|nr:deoxyguanosinetriphosphate triphosphohydrolase [Oceanirhabdus sp. W0125-5]WBW95760.1 deoxyguanosinetriphosphate triphosphohydrolase [Oceanirhabdus sp. W0125-5]